MIFSQFYILLFLYLVLQLEGGDWEGRPSKPGGLRRKQNFKRLSKAYNPDWRSRKPDSVESFPTNGQRVSNARSLGKGRTIAKGWGSGTGGSSGEQNGRLPDKQCRLASGRKKRQATAALYDGDKFHISKFRPDTHSICLSVHKGVLTAQHPIGLWYCHFVKTQIWMFEVPTWAPDDSWGIIRNFESRKCLDVEDRQVSDGTPIGVFDCRVKAPNQLWRVVDAGAGQVLLQDYNSCKCLSIEDLDPADNTKWNAELGACRANGIRPDQVWSLKLKAKGHATLYTGTGWQGDIAYVHSNGECANVPEWIQNDVSSVDNHWGCVVVYEHPGCQGWSVKFSQGENEDQRRALNCCNGRLNDKVRSVKAC